MTRAVALGASIARFGGKWRLVKLRDGQIHPVDLVGADAEPGVRGEDRKPVPWLLLKGRIYDPISDVLAAELARDGFAAWLRNAHVDPGPRHRQASVAPRPANVDEVGEVRAQLAAAVARIEQLEELTGRSVPA